MVFKVNFVKQNGQMILIRNAYCVVKPITLITEYFIALIWQKYVHNFRMWLIISKNKTILGTPSFCTSISTSLNSSRLFLSIGSLPENLPIEIDPRHLRFYTDGGCDDPTEVDFRHGCWSVAWDNTNSDIKLQAQASQIDPVVMKSNLFECVASGHVSGPQSSRGEIQACVVACRATNQVHSSQGKYL